MAKKKQAETERGDAPDPKPGCAVYSKRMGGKTVYKQVRTTGQNANKSIAAHEKQGWKLVGSLAANGTGKTKIDPNAPPLPPGTGITGESSGTEADDE